MRFFPRTSLSARLLTLPIPLGVSQIFGNCSISQRIDRMERIGSGAMLIRFILDIRCDIRHSLFAELGRRCYNAPVSLSKLAAPPGALALQPQMGNARRVS